MPQHLMIDLETGGTSPGAAIFSIGACVFDPMTQNPPTLTFYEEISHSSCMELGLRFERDTMNWWGTQSISTPNGTTHIKQALKKFILWLSNVPGKTNNLITLHWANSPSFDIALLKHVLDRYNMRWPFPFYTERDVRTLKAIAFPNNDYQLNNSHNALQDAINQATLVQHAYLALALSTPGDSQHDYRPQPHPPGVPEPA